MSEGVIDSYTAFTEQRFRVCSNLFRRYSLHLNIGSFAIEVLREGGAADRLIMIRCTVSRRDMIYDL